MLMTRPYMMPRRTVGSVLHFDGTANSYVDCGDIYDLSTKLWVSCWVKFDSFAAYSIPWSKGSGNDSLRLYLNSQLIRVSKTTGGVSDFDLSSGINAIVNNWYHVLLSISDVNGARLIVNGGTPSTNADTSSIPDCGNFIIGSGQAGAEWNVTGVIANVIVGTDDLTTAEEAGLYNGIIPADRTDLWYLDEGRGTTAYSYGTNNGTKGSSALWQYERLPYVCLDAQRGQR
jgi:hypothetical protein